MPFSLYDNTALFFPSRWMYALVFIEPAGVGATNDAMNDRIGFCSFISLRMLRDANAPTKPPN